MALVLQPKKGDSAFEAMLLKVAPAGMTRLLAMQLANALSLIVKVVVLEKELAKDKELREVSPAKQLAPIVVTPLGTTKVSNPVEAKALLPKEVIALVEPKLTFFKAAQLTAKELGIEVIPVEGRLMVCKAEQRSKMFDPKVIAPEDGVGIVIVVRAPSSAKQDESIKVKAESSVTLDKAFMERMAFLPSEVKVVEATKVVTASAL